MDSNDPNNSNNPFGGAPLPDTSETVAPSLTPPGMDTAQTPTTPPSPWDTISTQPPAPAPGFMPSATPAEPVVAPLTESPWPVTSATAADVPTAPAGPAEINPFLQSQNTPGLAPTLSQPPAVPDPAAPTPNPLAGGSPDPLNTAFAPTAAPENPFASPSTTLPADPTQPAPGSPNPWDQPVPTGAPAPATDPVSPSLNLMSQGQPGNPSPDSAPIQDQSIPANPQSAPLDLSSVQSETATTFPLPETGPVENAPTDLSHLIAGDETSPQQTNGVYTPPVAADQNIPVSPVPAPEADGQTPPPGKHLNLTKVLLVAGIPIILIVAALSAYLILGVGQTKPQQDQTSLPIEQTNQAPLTNPPQQIVAPSPVTLPEPGTTLPTTDLNSPSPSPSLSPAMRAAQQQASSPSPSSSTSTSLPQ